MKTGLAAALLVAVTGVCTPAPCSAQGQENGATAEAVPAQQVTAAQLFCVMLESVAAQELEIYHILQGITDKETADAAAPLLETCLDHINACMPSSDEAYDRLLTAVEEEGGDIDALIAGHYDAKAGTAYTDIRNLVAGLAALEPPFYGSEGMQKLMERKSFLNAEAEDDTTATYTQEQLDTACGYMDAAFSRIAPLKEALLTVKDRESADAAATAIATLRDEIDGVWVEMSDWLSENNVPDEIGDALLDLYADQLEKAAEVDDVITSLSEAEQPFFGSEALEAALRMDEGGDEETSYGTGQSE